MDWTPVIGKSRTVKYIPLSTGKHTALILDEIESLGLVQYLYILVVFDDSIKQPCLFISSELNKTAEEPGEGSHFLGVFSGDEHHNLGASDDWADIVNFEREAVKLAFEYLNESSSIKNTETTNRTHSSNREISAKSSPLKDRPNKAIEREKFGDIKSLDAEVDGETKAKVTVDRLIGNSKAIQNLRKEILDLADTDLNVVIQGESGTGKNFVANLLHKISDRSDWPIIEVHCDSVHKEFGIFELFGYEKGAFSEARKMGIGKFERANRSTILLEQFADLSLEVQSKLARFYDFNTLTRIGGINEIEIDVRTICTIRQEPEDLIASGALLKELYFRLNEATIILPPLRDRPEDIELFANFFIEKYIHLVL